MNKEASLEIGPRDSNGNFPGNENKRIDIFEVLDEEKKKILDEIEEDYKDWAEGRTERIKEPSEYVILNIESEDLKEGEEDVVEEYVNLINKDIRKKYCECLERYAKEVLTKDISLNEETPVPKPLGADVARKINPINIEKDNMEIPTVPPSVDDLLDKAKKKMGDSQLVSAGKGKLGDSGKKETVKKKTGEKKTQPIEGGGNGKKKLEKVGGEGGLADLEKVQLKKPDEETKKEDLEKGISEDEIVQQAKDFADSMFEALGADVAAINSVKKLLEGRMANMDENQKNSILKYVDEKIPKDMEAETPKSIVENFLKENGIKIKEGKGRTKTECFFVNDSDPGMYFYIYSVENSGKISIWDQRKSGRQSYITFEELKELMKDYHQKKDEEEKDENPGEQEIKKEPIQEAQKTEESAVQKKEAGEKISANEFFKKYGDKYRDRKKFFPENDFGSWMIVSGFDEKEGMVKVSFESIDKKSGKIIGSGGKMTVPNFEKTIKKYSLSEKEMEERKNEREKNTKKRVGRKTDNEQKEAVMTKNEFEEKFKHIFKKNLFENGKRDGAWIYVEDSEGYNENTGEVKILLNGRHRRITPEELEEMLKTYKEIERKSEDVTKGEMNEEEAEKLVRELIKKFQEEDYKKIDFGSSNVEMKELKTTLIFLDKDSYEKMEKEASDLFFTYRDKVVSREISWRECYERFLKFKPKLDDFWLRLKKESEENKNKTEDNIKKSGNFQDLFEAIDGTKGIPGIDKYYYSEELKIIINNIRHGNIGIDSIPETIGLRDKVNELFEKERGERREKERQIQELEEEGESFWKEREKNTDWENSGFSEKRKKEALKVIVGNYLDKLVEKDAESFGKIDEKTIDLILQKLSGAK